jgi:hypothetical protein
MERTFTKIPWADKTLQRTAGSASSSCSGTSARRRLSLSRFAPLFLLPLLLFTGCPAVDTREFDFTRSKPKPSEVVGTWTPDQKSIDDIRNRGRYTNIHPTVTLRADGTFSIRDMPDWWSDGSGDSHGTGEALDGKWSFEQQKEVWNVWVISLQTPMFRSVHLYRQKAPFALFIGVGDPNDANAMIFERAKPQ